MSSKVASHGKPWAIKFCTIKDWYILVELLKENVVIVFEGSFPWSTLGTKVLHHVGVVYFKLNFEGLLKENVVMVFEGNFPW